jgi:hypothetical protein
MNIYPPGTRITARYEVVGRPLLGGIGIVYLSFDHQEQRLVWLLQIADEQKREERNQ